jgi:hypothetical protein
MFLNILIFNETVNIINVDNLFNITTKRTTLLNNFNENYNSANINLIFYRNEDLGPGFFIIINYTRRLSHREINVYKIKNYLQPYTRKKI